MLSKDRNNIIYSNKNWNDVTNKYDLLNDLEIVIKKESSEPVTDQNLVPASHASWLSRSAVFIALVAVIGNIPVQSHLIKDAQANSTVKTFEIIPNEINIASNITDNSAQATQLSSTQNDLQQDQIDNLEDILNGEDILESKELELPARALETYAGQVNADNTSKWITYHVKSYDNATNIFHKVGHQALLKTLKNNKEIYSQIKALKKGSIVRANSTEGDLSDLVFTHTNDSKRSYVISKQGEDYKGTWKDNVFEVRQARASFTIQNGLFFDGKKAKVDNKVIKQLVKVFDWDIDFSHDVRVGDKVTAVFEEIFHDGDKVGTQNLLAAEFINKGRQFRSIRYTYADGKSDYFTPQGREMKKAFIRTPIEHARVSSHFNPGRFHPKLHKFRAHKGTDFAARTGTPIMTTGNGVVQFLGRKGGYGRTVIIKHREGYTTTYAHMSRYKKGLKVGDKVYQSDLIGYVGQSGLATGPHLHYELHQDKKAVNAMTVALPNSMSLSRSELQDFRNKAVNLVLQLNVLHRFVEADIEIDSAIGG
ncbi:peptidoglycan DD-metalloendopeptidase family protein [uncultured Cocleimonas sp.]|uniref:M23 family metallopeptidase n=1 Tax=uncultured Cocleimonas sp. TaxID=1051587 RepID=UPI00261F358C|nr:peptidoglycan DD-metalloendopeptidase family protein [uncultured Cocleimonas sp.]